jgi:hypothetical protein
MRMMSALLLLVLIWPGAACAAQLRLTWADNSYNEAGFLIERRWETEDTFIPITTVGMNITAYVDTTVDAGITYCYQVSAFSAEGVSAPSTEVCGQGR